MALLLPFDGVEPVIHPSAFVAPDAVLIGNVTVEAESSVWFGAVLRGDHPEHGILIGSRTTIGDGTVVGMNAVILQDARVGSQCVVAAGAVVKEGARIPDRSLVAGVPAEVKKTLEGRALEWVRGGGEHYVRLSRRYLEQGLDG